MILPSSVVVARVLGGRVVELGLVSLLLIGNQLLGSLGILHSMHTGSIRRRGEGGEGGGKELNGENLEEKKKRRRQER